MRPARAIVLALALPFGASCSSGSSPSTPASFAPSATPTPITRPIATGDTFTYAHNETTATYAVGGGTTIDTTGSDVETVAGTTTFNGKPVIDVRSVEQLAHGEAPDYYINATSDDYQALLPVQSGQELVRYGTAVAATHTVPVIGTLLLTSSSTTTYGVPFIIDVLPEVSGARWTGAQQYVQAANESVPSLNGQLAYTVKDTLTQSQDGSHTDYYLFQSTYNGLPYSAFDRATVNPDGSGKDYSGQTYSPGGPPSNEQTVLTGVPFRDTNGLYYIPVTLLGQIPTQTNVPDWYPGHALPPRPLVADDVVDAGAVQIPPSCGASGTKATQANGIVETLSGVDPVRSTTLNRVTQTYVVPGAGVVCVIEQTTTTYYDLSGTANFATLDQLALGLTSEKVVSGRRRHAGSIRPSASVGAPFPAAVAAHRRWPILRRCARSCDAPPQ
jgi:hypothetical protein